MGAGPQTGRNVLNRAALACAAFGLGVLLILTSCGRHEPAGRNDDKEGNDVQAQGTPGAPVNGSQSTCRDYPNLRFCDEPPIRGYFCGAEQRTSIPGVGSGTIRFSISKANPRLRNSVWLTIYFNERVASDTRLVWQNGIWRGRSYGGSPLAFVILSSDNLPDRA